MGLSLTRHGELLVLYYDRKGNPEGWVRDLAFLNSRDAGVVARACRMNCIAITSSDGKIDE